MNKKHKHKHKSLTDITWLALWVASVLVVIKLVAWFLTSSVALLASFLDSLMDLMISGLNFFAVRRSLAPPDKQFRFGYGKIEALVALGQGVVIMMSAFFLFQEAVKAILVPRLIDNDFVGIGVMVFATLLTCFLFREQTKIIKQTKSLAIEADSKHYQGDIYINLSVLGVLVLAGPFGITIADPLLGLGVVGLLIWNAWEIVKKAIAQLLDKELDEEEREKIKSIVLSHPEVRGLHDLRTRVSGMQKFIQCHIELDKDLSLDKAHDISDEVEALLMKSFSDTQVIIHQDPEGLETLTKLEKT